MNGPDTQEYNCLDGTLLCTKPFLHFSLGKAGPFTLESPLHVS